MHPSALTGQVARVWRISGGLPKRHMSVRDRSDLLLFLL
jgi:hypothetical protein